MKFLFGIMIIGMAACGTPTDSQDNSTDSEATTENTEAGNETEKTVYAATLTSVNSDLLDKETTGKARFVVEGDSMTVTIDVVNAPVNMAHWQHFHGFKDGKAASCPSDNADTNGDGIIDLIETEEASGTTMVPFNDLPSAMKVANNTYPEAKADGTYHYEVTVSMSDLQSAFAEAFGGDIALDTRVLYIHGVPSDMELPETVQSLGEIPAQVTLPIACGKIVKVSGK